MSLVNLGWWHMGGSFRQRIAAQEIKVENQIDDVDCQEKYIAAHAYSL